MDCMRVCTSLDEGVRKFCLLLFCALDLSQRRVSFFLTFRLNRTYKTPATPMKKMKVLKFHCNAKNPLRLVTTLVIVSSLSCCDGSGSTSHKRLLLSAKGSTGNISCSEMTDKSR